MTTPEKDGFFLPPDWAPHKTTLMAWPCRESLWGDLIEEAREAYAELAMAIGHFEPVTMITSPLQVAEASLKCRVGVSILPFEQDDSWIRDNGPSFLIDGAGNLAAVDWDFNGWGRRFEPFTKDAALSASLIERYRASSYSGPLVLEGGSIQYDGEGTLIAVEKTIINQNRNPDRPRQEVEKILSAHTGALDFIWLDSGLYADETDGQVDNLAVFLKPGVVGVMVSDDPNDADYDILQRARDYLGNQTDAQGRLLEVVEFPQPKTARGLRGERLLLSYTSVHFCNGGLIVPAFDDASDDKAFEIYSELFPDRKVVQVPMRTILHGGGGIHAVTLPVPTGTLEH